MSCKNRGTISDPKDFYATPKPAITRDRDPRATDILFET